ncbi:MAG: NAD(P)H-dependent oxidoreductase [Bacteroidales bacterium]|nr:NAD(P)H-dependent oxidoreductase [Bacteroidales bacterium]
MKVLAIMGSPRKNGKGFQIVKKIEDQLKSYSEIDFEYVFLKDLNLELCRGCFQCIVQGEEKCPINDGQKQLEAKMLEANGIIFCSPVYGLNVSGLMKIFIDRFSYNGHHPRFFKQNALFVANTCGMGLKGALNAMKFIAVWGFHVVGEIGIKWPHYKQSEKEQNKNEKLITRASEKLYQNMIIETPKPQTNQVKHYCIMKTMMRSFKNYDKMFPGDLRYWEEKGWLKKETSFFYEAKLTLYQKVLAFFLRSFFRAVMPMMAGN